MKNKYLRKVISFNIKYNQFTIQFYWEIISGKGQGCMEIWESKQNFKHNIYVYITERALRVLKYILKEKRIKMQKWCFNRVTIK